MLQRTALFLAFAVSFAPGSAQAEPPARASGSTDATLEVLPAPPASGELRVPEGFIRLEGPPEEGTSSSPGSFGVYRPSVRARSDARAAPDPSRPNPEPATAAAPPSELPAAEPQAASPSPDGCRAERSAYLKRVLHMQGIEVSDPVAFLQGLAGPERASGSYLFSSYGLLPGFDPVRPLAWDSELRSRARELAACAR